MADYIERQKALDTVFRSHSVEGAHKFLAAIKPADVRPVVRGRWIGNKRHQSCSECHMTYCVPDGQDGELDMTAYHYCPNCGADMREER